MQHELRRTEHGHFYAEAFCLMHYKCEKCGKLELLWNSRDGVTPFMISCSNCKGTMAHANWNLDKYAPDHKPQVGDRVFRDSTEADKREWAQRSYENAKGTPYAIPEDIKDQWIEEFVKEAQDGPVVETVTEENMHDDWRRQEEDPQYERF